MNKSTQNNHQPHNTADDPSKENTTKNTKCSSSDNPKSDLLNNEDLNSLMHALENSLNLLELKRQKASTILHLAIAETKLSVVALFHSAIVLSAIAALTCFTWILLNVSIVVFISGHYSTIYAGLGLSIGLHLTLILFCFIKLQSLKRLVGFTRIKKILE